MTTLRDDASVAAAGELQFDPDVHALFIKRVGDWLVHVAPMIFNDRVLLTHRDEYPLQYTAGFCYEKGGAAVLAALAWDVEAEREPAGYKKRACDRREQ